MPDIDAAIVDVAELATKAPVADPLWISIAPVPSAIASLKLISILLFAAIGTGAVVTDNVGIVVSVVVPVVKCGFITAVKKFPAKSLMEFVVNET